MTTENENELADAKQDTKTAKGLSRELRERAEYRASHDGPFTKENLVEWRAAEFLDALTGTVQPVAVEVKGLDPTAASVLTEAKAALVRAINRKSVRDSRRDVNDAMWRVKTVIGMIDVAALAPSTLAVPGDVVDASALATWADDYDTSLEMSRRRQVHTPQWTKKKKGTATVHTHPRAYNGRAIVENVYGISFNGVWYDTLEGAKAAALSGQSSLPAGRGQK